MGWASSPVLVVSALARYGTRCASHSCLLQQSHLIPFVQAHREIKIRHCKVRSSTRVVVTVLLLYVRMLSTTTTIALIPLSIPAALIHRRRGCLILTIRWILLSRGVLHHIKAQTERRRKPWIDVRLYRMLLRRYELVLILLLLHRRIRLRKAELW